MSATAGKISYRNVSCDCTSGEMCDCYDLKQFTFLSAVSRHWKSTTTMPMVSLIDCMYVVVKYDANAYPDIVMDEDHTGEMYA